MSTETIEEGADGIHNLFFSHLSRQKRNTMKISAIFFEAKCRKDCPAGGGARKQTSVHIIPNEKQTNRNLHQFSRTNRQQCDMVVSPGFVFLFLCFQYFEMKNYSSFINLYTSIFLFCPKIKRSTSLFQEDNAFRTNSICIYNTRYQEIGN